MNRFFKILMLIGLTSVVVSCQKDPVIKEAGAYAYVDGKFVPAEKVGSEWVLWSEEVTEVQKNAIREIVNEMVQPVGYSYYFLMGGTDEYYAQSSELPVHGVNLSPFQIGKYEVSQKQWMDIMSYDLGWSDEFGKGDAMPAYNVSYEDAQAFFSKLNTLTNLHFRLPTEAEWEYAARANYSYSYSGSNEVDDVAWTLSNSGNKVHEIGSKLCNNFGLYDMSGNVWEWCSDWYGPYPVETQTDPTGPENGTVRVIRGGGFLHLGKYSRVAYREGFASNVRSISHGFRIVLEKTK